MKHSSPAFSCPSPLMPSTAVRLLASQVVSISLEASVPDWKKAESHLPPCDGNSIFTGLSKVRV